VGDARNVSLVVVSSPLGRLGLRLTADGLLACIEFVSDDSPLTRRPPSAARRVIEALQICFESAPCVDLPPLVPAPTPFQQRVREALLAIPPGQVRTYGQLARQLGSAPRAVGQACRRNPVPILVPCHRVVAASGLGGYAGETAGRRRAIKLRLLELEGLKIR